MELYEFAVDNHPQREIDDTNGWCIARNVKVLFWKQPCSHAIEVTGSDVGYCKAILPNAVQVLSQCYVGSTVCLDCLLEQHQRQEGWQAPTLNECMEVNFWMWQNCFTVTKYGEAPKGQVCEICQGDPAICFLEPNPKYCPDAKGFWWDGYCGDGGG